MSPPTKLVDTMDDAKTRRRCTHSKHLKSKGLAACAEPGASVAAVALAWELNYEPGAQVAREVPDVWK